MRKKAPRVAPVRQQPGDRSQRLSRWRARGHDAFESQLSRGRVPASTRSAKGDLQSFVYDAKLDHDQELQIDLALEGSVRPQLPLCVNAPAGNLESALKIAALVGADQALVLRVESYNSEPGWVAAVLFEVQKGARVREGGMKVTAARSGSGYSDLASFVLTGEPAKLSFIGAPLPLRHGRQVRPAPRHRARPRRWPRSAPRARRARASPASSQASAWVSVSCSPLPEASTTPPAVAAAPRLPTRPTQTATSSTRPRPATLFLEQKVSSNNTVSLALGLTGVAILAAGAVLFFVLPSSHEGPAVSAMVTPAGAFVGLSGALP